MVKADFVVSDHYEVHERLRALQEQFGAGHFTTHCTLCGSAMAYQNIDHWWGWRRAAATSMETAVRIGLAVGFKEIILCGCPLTAGEIQHPDQVAKDGAVWPPPRDVIVRGEVARHDTSDDVLRSFRIAFTKLAAKWKGQVFSMSGFTRQILGPPPADDVQSAIARSIWTGEKGARLAFPSRMGRWPDDDAVEILQRLCVGNVCEIGCGTGRCAEAFGPDRYMGIDVNPAAIVEARKQFQRHRFAVVDWTADYPDADTYLFYTVLLHVPDCEIPSVLERTRRPESKPSRLVIFESMCGELRKVSTGAFNRDESAYVQALAAMGRRVVSIETLPSKWHPFTRTFMVAE